MSHIKFLLLNMIRDHKRTTLAKGIALLLLSVYFISCEKEIKVNVSSPANAIVVEGHIENGIPPYVLLTRNSGFFGNINVNDISSYFINGATITVKTDDDSVHLVEYNSVVIRSLPDSVAIALAAQFGVTIKSASEFPAITIYTVSPSDSLFVGKIGKQYDLRIEVNGKTLTSTTTIPEPVFFDSLWIVPHPNPIYADSFFMLHGRLQDPPVPGNYYRYFTKVDNEPFLISDQSVFDDAFINGKKFDIFLPKGHPVGFAESQDFNTGGYWNVSDTVCTVKLCMIDKAHYDFWRTLEAERNSQGNPFGSFVYVKSNVNGALGVWGGYGSITGSFHRF